MNVSLLTMTAADLEIIVEHCRRELPNEACGILAGRAGRVEGVHPVQSASPSPTRYTMDPGGQFRALDEIGRAGRDLVGIYHSHPGGPALPSCDDLEESWWPGTRLPNYPEAVQVIVSLQDRQTPVVKGYAPAGGTLVEVRIAIDR